MPANDLLRTLIDDYCRAWSETDKATREALLRAVLVDEVCYMDPSAQLVGVRQLSDHIDTVVARYPGSTIVVTSVLDVHHGFLRFGWKKVLADGTSLLEGVDFCELAADGKLARIVGFFGLLRPPSETIQANQRRT